MGGTSWAFFLGSLASNPEALVNINTVNFYLTIFYLGYDYSLTLTVWILR